MSAKSMFMRITRIFRAPQTTETDAMSWLIERHDTPTYAKADAASIPLPTRTAEPGEIDQMTDTTIMAPIVDRHTDMVAYHLETAADDTDFTHRAATALKMGSVKDVLEGLMRYVALNPTGALEGANA